MSEAGSVMQFGAPDDREEIARAEIYGLLANLFIAPPPAEMHEQLRVAVTEAPAAGGMLEASWSDVVEAARRLSVEQIAQEYTALFGGVGKPEVLLYGSWHLAGSLNEKPLVELRDSLAALGLERASGVLETEDHLASLCEVMRFLIAGDDPAAGDLALQKRFFDAHLRPWTDALCDAIEASAQADFYRAVAAFARDFFAVEGQAFDWL